MKVLVADADAAFRDLMKVIIDLEPSLTLIGSAGNDDEAVRLARDFCPDVVLLDVQMLGGGGVRAATDIRQACPGVRILALSGTRDREQVIAMLRAGAVGYLTKAATPGEILRMIADTSADNVSLPEALADDAEVDLATREEKRLIQSLLPGDGFNLVVQPIFDLATAAVVGHEALARFTPEPRSRPDAWFRRAEKVGLRVELELAVLTKALRMLTLIPPDTYLSVNLSPDAVISDLCETALRASQPDRVVIELTEHLAVLEYARLRDRLADLRALGVRFAVDDVGAGFASLRHILELSPDFIKLDISLIRDIDHDSPRRALATALITFARELDAGVIAEGVETERELQTLRDLDVGYAQGFYLGRPTPIVAPPPLDSDAVVDGLVAAAITAIVTASDAAEAIEGLGLAISPYIPLARVSLRVLTQPDRLKLVAVWADRDTMLKPGSWVSAVATSFPEVVRSNRAVCSSDPGVYLPVVERLLADEGNRSWVSVPLRRASGGIPGMLSFSSHELDAFDETKIDVLARIGSAVEMPLLDLAERTP